MPCVRVPLLLAGLTLLPAAGTAQTIQRREGADRRLSYANAECPPGAQMGARTATLAADYRHFCNR